MNIEHRLLVLALGSLFWLWGCGSPASDAAGEATAEHAEQEISPHAADSSVLAAGQGYALATKAVLGKNLMQAIQQDGPEHALAFCHVRALPLTDSMAKEQGVLIRRVSDQPRNPANRAQGEALAYIQQAKERLARGQQVSGAISTGDTYHTGYYPIMTNGMCLQCHGVPNQDVQAKTLEKIASLYPEDEATGYGLNELRGIWVIQMPREEEGAED